MTESDFQGVYPRELTLPEAVAKMRDLLSRLPGESWQRATLCKDGEEPKTVDEACELVAQCLRHSDNPIVDGVFASDIDSWICHTGNGPNAELIAKFITLARNWLPRLLNVVSTKESTEIVIKRMEVVARVKELEAENAELQQKLARAGSHRHYCPRCTTTHDCEDDDCDDAMPRAYGSDRYCCGPGVDAERGRS